MNQIIKAFPLLILPLLSIHYQQNLSAQTSKIDLKIISSENGYALIPDMIRIVNLDNQEEFSGGTFDSYNSLVLPYGNYALFIGKDGYSSCETYFSISGKNIRYDIYLDPLNKDPLLTAARIKQITKENSALLLGYVVDDETGAPLGSVIVKDDKSNVFGSTNYKGYFEFYIPAGTDTRTFINLTFEKAGYDGKEYQDFELLPKTDFILRVRLKSNGLLNLNRKNGSIENECSECSSPLNLVLPYSGFVLPLNIRVGRNCTGTNCTYAEVYSLETYCKYVLPAEVYPCWGSINGGMNSLQACAVAVRSYGVCYVYNPINPSLYDICDNTSCQVFGNTQSSNTNNAVDNTYRNILTNTSGVVMSEYSAENNNRGCGNGYSGTGSGWPCIYDPVCLNATPNGHGRGLCQWGSVRWATGTLITLGSPCSPGVTHSYGTKTWQQILTHYYNVSPYNWNVTLGITATINSSSASPSASTPCSTITIANSVNATNTVSLILGASIALTGTTNWISDPYHDVKLIFNQGTGNYNRLFTIPCSAQPGTYDLLTAVWYDKDNNNQINLGDFVVHSRLTPNALTISPVGIQPIASEIPSEFSLSQNYPNPFNPSTKIDFDLPKSSTVRLVIYDVLGREVSEPLNEKLQPGKYSYEWNAVAYPSGAYYYKLTAHEVLGSSTGDSSQTRKMVLIR
jgi:hypothetical protein